MSERDHTPTTAALERVPSDRLHPLVEVAMAQGGQLEPQTLRELLELQREWQAGEAKRAYTTSLVALKRDLPSVLKRDKLVSYKTKAGPVAYRHTTLASAMDAVQAPLQAHGFSVAWLPSTEGGKVTVSCRLTHAAGHSEEASLTAPPDNSGSKSPAQSIASTITLLERYTLLALLGIATGDQVEDGPDGINPERNLKAVAHLREVGIPLPEAEDAVGAAVAAWTKTHLEQVWELVRARRSVTAGGTE